MSKERWLLARAEREIRVRLANGAGTLDPREFLHAWLCFELKKPPRDCNPLAMRAVATLVEELRPHYCRESWQDARARVRSVLAKQVCK